MLFGGESKKREILKSTDELASLTQVDLGLNYDHRGKTEKPVILITGFAYENTKTPPQRQ